MAPRSVWKGSLRFGLAMIPVSVTSGIENNKGIEFRQIHTADGARIRFRKFCEGCGEAIPPEEQGKGYERDDGTIIAMDDEDFESLPLATGKTLDVLQFSPADQIGPELTDRLYYLHPGDGADKAYGLIFDAMLKAKRVAIVMAALRSGREHLAVIRPHKGALAMLTLRWPDEIRPAPDIGLPATRKNELAMATTLIESMSADFDPSAYKDGYKEALIEVIEAKSAGTPLAARPEPESPKETSLAEVLAASLAALEPTATTDAKSLAAPRKRAPRKRVAS